ncbi:MAG TPA: DNA repair exonuclease [Bacteroidetes bacterium]|nr:DNA repair exonuclease [Bacteroidota bacterium]
MTKIKFIHTADLHLDTPFRGLSEWNPELAGRLRDATFQSFRNIVNLCLSEEVDFLLIAGDIFDSENRSLAAQLRFVAELKRLTGRDIPVYFVCGNHDPLDSWMESLHLPEGVHRFGTEAVEHITFARNNQPVADIYGISFPEKSVRENLALQFERKIDPAPFSIALLHGTVGNPGPHENYAPFRMDEVANKPFDYWALGHIHKPAVIREAHPAMVYPGNPQGRDFGETGPRGCYLVELSANQKPRLRFLPAQVIRFETVTADLTGEDRFDRLPARVEEAIKGLSAYNESASYMIRLTLSGRTPLHVHLNRPGETTRLAELLNEGQSPEAPFTRIDRIDIRTRPDMDLDQVRKGTDFPAEVLKVFDTYEKDPEKLRALLTEIEKEFGHHAARRHLSELPDEEMNELLDRARWLLMDRLTEEKETS